MITYEDWLGEQIPITKTLSIPRKEYYQKYMSNFNPRDAYDQLTKCTTFSMEEDVK